MKKQSILFNFKKYRALYIMLIPGIVFLLINNYLPMFGAIIAFKRINFIDGIWGSPWSGLENFRYLFSTADAWVITRNTILYNSVFIIMHLIFGVLFAIMLVEVRNRLLSKFYQSVMFLPFFLSMVVVSYLVLAMLSMDNGLVNKSILPMFDMEPITWYSDPKYWPFILPLVDIWKNIGYYVVLYMAGILGFDQEYFEAAVLDGASKWQQIKHITIPLLTPLMVILTILQIGRIFYADFGLFFQVPLNSGMLYPTTNVIDTYVYTTFLFNGDTGMASAAGLYQAVVGFTLVLTANYIVRKVNKENALF
jgi:putative aldouronate transport system permease protein